jgi:murein DD-endopeptidase MepM/ murein hydrolase activator NlpD
MRRLRVAGRRAAVHVLPTALLLGLLLSMAPIASESAAAPPAPVTGFVLPVPAPPLILTPFAPPANPYGAGHRGVDLAAQPGTAVWAAGSGVVIYAGALAGRGVVSVEHAGGLRTTYEPVTARVSVGARVAAGDQIGVVEAGHPGCAPASCLHWGARLPDRVYLDPMALLRPWTVRLWPWDGR